MAGRSNAMVRIKNSELKYENTTWKKKRRWKRNEMVGMRPTMSMDDLDLHYFDDKNYVKKRVTDLDFKGAITSMEIERTIEGASTVTVVLRDPNQRIFSREANRMRDSKLRKYKRHPVPVDEAWRPINIPTLIGRAVEIDLDGVVFRLTKVSYVHSTQELTLVFEDRIIYWLRKKGGHGKGRYANRKKVTRAEFILALLREVKAEKVPFICPALHDKQKIAQAE
jgi:hypothetical protein